MQLPGTEDIISSPGDPFSELFKHIHVVGSVNSLSLRNKLLMDHSFAVEKDNELCLCLRLWAWGSGRCATWTKIVVSLTNHFVSPLERCLQFSTKRNRVTLLDRQFHFFSFNSNQTSFATKVLLEHTLYYILFSKIMF